MTPIDLDAFKASLAPALSVSPDLVTETLDRYRSGPPVEPVPASGKPNFRKASEVHAKPEPIKASHKPNRYGKSCSECGSWVPEGEGRLDKVDGVWTVSHLAGQCPQAAASAEEVVSVTSTASVSQVTIKAVTGQVYTGIHPGIYTLPTADGHRTFRVRVQGTEGSFAPGQTVLEYLTGSDNTKDYTGFGFLRGNRLAVWKSHQDKDTLIADAKAFLADVEAAEVAVTCIRCSALLTTPESIVRGLGPTCLTKGW